MVDAVHKRTPERAGIDLSELRSALRIQEPELLEWLVADLSAGDFAIVGHPHFVGNVAFGELLFGFSNERNLGNCVDTVRIACRVGFHGKPKGTRRGDATL